MTLHSLVLISDSFSCNCNSIQSPVSIVHLRVNLILSHPLLRLYINYSISNANHFQLAQQCIQISTRINSSSVHTYIFVCFTLRVILQGFVTQNATTATVAMWKKNATMTNILFGLPVFFYFAAASIGGMASNFGLFHFKSPATSYSGC